MHRVRDVNEETKEGFCSECNTIVPVYLKRQNRPSGLGDYWKCKIKKRSEYRRAPVNAVKVKMFEEQDGCCKICSIPIEVRSAHLDHDHSCCSVKAEKACGNCYRGLLCSSCNMGLGFFKDNIDTMQRAIAYLEARLSLFGEP